MNEILEAEAREDLIAQGVAEFSVDFILDDMRSMGMFDPEPHGSGREGER